VAPATLTRVFDFVQFVVFALVLVAYVIVAVAVAVAVAVIAVDVFAVAKIVGVEQGIDLLKKLTWVFAVVVVVVVVAVVVVAMAWSAIG
jgi:hypothetical protein